MKWAGLETPKCVTVHQRVNKFDKLCMGSTRRLDPSSHIARGWQPDYM